MMHFDVPHYTVSGEATPGVASCLVAAEVEMPVGIGEYAREPPRVGKVWVASISKTADTRQWSVDRTFCKGVGNSGRAFKTTQHYTLTPNYYEAQSASTVHTSVSNVYNVYRAHFCVEFSGVITRYSSLEALYQRMQNDGYGLVEFMSTMSGEEQVAYDAMVSLGIDGRARVVEALRRAQVCIPGTKALAMIPPKMRK